MPILRPFAIGYPILVILLAFFGMLVAIRRRWREALPPLLFGGTVVAGALLFYGSPRMRAPMEPMLVVFAAVGLAFLFELAWRRVMRARHSTITSQ